MKNVFFAAIISLSWFGASAEAGMDKAVNSLCLESVIQLRQLPEIKVPAALQASVKQAIVRAKRLTEDFGISARVVTISLVGPKNSGSTISEFGLFIRVADDADRGQANAYEFTFEIVSDKEGKNKLHLLTMTDDWHTHGDYKTVFVCEAN